MKIISLGPFSSQAFQGFFALLQAGEKMAGLSRRKISGFSGNQLKIIGITSMAIDHIGYVLLPAVAADFAAERTPWTAAYFLCRLIGRLAFPVFAFLLTEGFFHTKNIKKYMGRLGLFALISEIPFDMAAAGKPFYFSVQNVFFTLFIGLSAMYYIDRWKEKPVLQCFMALSAAAISYAIKSDYGGAGIILILIFYMFRFQKKERTIGGAVGMACMIQQKWEIGYFAALPFLYAYNGSPGRKKSYFGYWFYPVHLGILAGIRYVILQF